ncbi:MAG: hypothetical protein COT67_00525, partial [Candidatus Tagabacteria bacterium CG09_land_8_20_14_0_10_41_14]
DFVQDRQPSVRDFISLDKNYRMVRLIFAIFLFIILWAIFLLRVSACVFDIGPDFYNTSSWSDNYTDKLVMYKKVCRNPIKWLAPIVGTWFLYSSIRNLRRREEKGKLHTTESNHRVIKR